MTALVLVRREIFQGF